MLENKHPETYKIEGLASISETRIKSLDYHTNSGSMIIQSYSIQFRLFVQDWPNLCWGWFNNIEVIH